MWRSLQKSFLWAAVVALAGAVAGLAYGLVSGWAMYPSALNAAAAGAIIASVVFTAIKMVLDP